MAVKLRKRYNTPSRDYRILTIAMNYDDDVAVRKIVEVLQGENLTEREERIITSLFSEPREVIKKIRSHVTA